MNSASRRGEPPFRPKLPSLTPRKVIAILKRHGFRLDHATGSHYVFYHHETKRRAMVAYHAKDLPLETLRSILKEAGISADELW